MNGVAGASAAIADAIRATGVIVHVEPGAFQRMVNRIEEPLVVHARGKFFSKHHRYLVTYKGLAFYTKSKEEVMLPTRTEFIEAQKIWVPTMT